MRVAEVYAWNVSVFPELYRLERKVQFDGARRGVQRGGTGGQFESEQAN